MLIRDTYSFGELQLINESADGKMVMRGLFGEAEVVNRNKRVYSRKTLANEVERLQTVINERRFLGELDHPPTPIVNLANASHLITELYMEGDKVMGTMEILNTPAGKIAQDLVRDGVKIGVSSRATGSLRPISEGKMAVGDDLSIKCWDIVADPSCIGANPVLNEGLTIMESYQEDFEKYRNEQIYIQALKDALNKK